MDNKKRNIVLTLIVLLAIGFASVSSVLVINGLLAIGENSDDFKIIFTSASIDGVKKDDVISESKTEISYETKVLSLIDEESTLEYEATNTSRNYDADVQIVCNIVDESENIIEGENEYVGVTYTPESMELLAGETKSGSIIAKLKKTVKEPMDINIKCTLTATPKERDEIPTTTTKKVEEPEVPGKIKLYNLIKNNASKDTINFSVNSEKSGTNGIYTTTETEGNEEVYYYRGNVDNNIIYNNMCWKIVRTTETKGIKIIYNGLPNNNGWCSNYESSTMVGRSQFNPDWLDNAYVGYMYGTPASNTYEETHTNTNSSTIKTYIDDWYIKNFDAEAESKLEDTVFCNDRSTVEFDESKIGLTGYSNTTLGYGKNITFYGATYRAWDYAITPSPSLVCPLENDKFTVSNSIGNGKLDYPVGLITLDEAVLAGFNTKSSDPDNYLDTANYLYNHDNYWTMSPAWMGGSWNWAFVGYINYGGITSTNSSVGANNLGVRPVVSLINATYVSDDGTGTAFKPYVVE